MSLPWLAAVWDPDVLYCDGVEPQADGQAANWRGFEDTWCSGVITQGELSMVVKNCQKGGKNSKI